MRLLARALFHQLRDVHGVPDDRGVLLEVAALLHDVGEVVNQRGHHKHSEYMIRWGRIPGLDDAGREMVALMARCHRKDAARAKQLINDVAAVEGAARPAAQADRAAAHRRRARHASTARASSRSCARGWATRSCSTSSCATARRATTPQLLRKADMFRDELGLDVRVTVARPVQPPLVEAAGTSGAMAAVTAATATATVTAAK